MGFVFGTKPCPPQFSDDAGTKVNPEFKYWVTTDQLLLRWLLNTMTTDMASQMMHYTCSKEVQDTARDLAGGSTRSRITLYKNELQRIRKGSMKMEEYLNKIKVYFL